METVIAFDRLLKHIDTHRAFGYLHVRTVDAPGSGNAVLEASIGQEVLNILGLAVPSATNPITKAVNHHTPLTLMILPPYSTLGRVAT